MTYTILETSSPLVISRYPDLRDALLRIYNAWLERGNGGLMTSVSALPGTGKTNFLHQIYEVREAMGLAPDGFVNLPMDLFIPTDRESHERRVARYRDIHIFRKYYADQYAMRRAVQEVLDLPSQQPGEIILPKFYDRSIGRVVNGVGLTIPIPAGAREFVTEGAMNAEILAPFQTSTRVEVLQIILVDDPEKVFQRVLKRDQKGERGHSDRREEWIEEFGFFVPLVQGTHLQFARIIVDRSAQYREMVSLEGIDHPFLRVHSALVAQVET